MCDKKINRTFRHKSSISEFGLPERLISNAEEWLEMRRITENDAKRRRRNNQYDE